MIYYAMYKGKGMVGNALVRFWKRSKYSHCELLVNGVCYSSSVMDGGVRGKLIDVLDESKWDLIEVPWAKEEDVLAYFDLTEGHHYSWASLIASQFFASGYDQPKAAFCSDWCAAALGIPNPVIYAPEDLGLLIKFINMVKGV